MPRVRLFHWKAAEAGPLIAKLRNAGYVLDYSEKLASWREIRESQADALVIDLNRAPFHGRETAVALRGSPKTRRAPIVFVGGASDKLEAATARHPRCSREAACGAAESQGAPQSRGARADGGPLRRSHGGAEMGIVKNMRMAVIDPRPITRVQSEETSGRSATHAKNRGQRPAADRVAQGTAKRARWERDAHRRNGRRAGGLQNLITRGRSGCCREWLRREIEAWLSRT